MSATEVKEANLSTSDAAVGGKTDQKMKTTAAGAGDDTTTTTTTTTPTNKRNISEVCIYQT